MAKKLPKILSLTAALAALSGGTAATVPTTATASKGTDEQTTNKNSQSIGEPNLFMSVGNDLLGLIVTKAADGTAFVQHYSHYSHSSHASHASHSSHYSSRY